MNEIASELYGKMENLDPEGDSGWDDLDDRERRFYVLCIEHLLRRDGLVLRALGYTLADNNSVNGRSEI